MAKFEVALTEKLTANELALPKEFNKERFVQNVIALSQSNDTLKEYLAKYGTDGGKQLMQGAMRAAFLNLDFISKEAYLIPYGKDLNFQIDYRGATKLAKQYSIRPIREIYAKVVRRGDTFQERTVDGKQGFIFEPIPFNNEEFVGVFGVVVFSDGELLLETMNMDEINAVKSKSKSAGSKSSPWSLFPQEMMKKSVIHRICKKIELDFSNSEQVQAFNSEDDYNNDDVERQAENDIIENANSTPFPSDEQEEVVVESEVVENAESQDEAPFK